jgi:diguanylate cyclase (GGDEF)-like protein
LGVVLLLPSRLSPTLIRLPRPTQHILLVEDNPHDLQRLTEIITSVISGVDLVYAASLADAFEQLENQPIDAILFALSTDLLGSVKCLLEHTDAPIIVLTSSASDVLALEALQGGADDYIDKHALNRCTLRHVLECAVARSIWRNHIHALCLIDDLTGLFNGRGFMMLGEQQLKIARRANSSVSLAFLDLDALKFINDNFGHIEGDRALRTTAMVLKIAFPRESDLIARLGGDEFAVLWIGDTTFSIDALRVRLKSVLESCVASQKLPYPLSISIGLCQYQGDFSNPLTEMLSEADQRMYEDKCRSNRKIV